MLLLTEDQAENVLLLTGGDKLGKVLLLTGGDQVEKVLLLTGSEERGQPMPSRRHESPVVLGGPVEI